MHVRRLGYALGAEVTGIEVSHSLDDATIAEIRKAWLENLVLCFPNQKLATKAEFAAFARRFGDLDQSGARTHRDPESPDLVMISNKPVGGKPWDGHKQGTTWHSDQSYALRSNVGTFLLSKEVPEVGGDTLFANQYVAYETLSPGMQRMLETLTAVHDAKMKAYEVPSAPGSAEKKIIEVDRRKDPPVARPLVMVHPETHRKMLFLGDRIRHFVGMTEEESRPILDFLTKHATAYELTYRHRWHANDLVMWDNRCLMHLALSDYDLYKDPRILWRCSSLAEADGYLYESENANAQTAAAVS